MNKSGVVVVLAIAALFALLTFTVDPFGLRVGTTDRTTADDDPAELRGEEEEAAPQLKVRIGPDGQPMVGGDPVGVLDLGMGTAVLRGTVTDESDAPIYLARAQLVTDKLIERGVRTKEDGRYEIRGVPEGQHEIRARMEGYRIHTEVAPKLVAGKEEVVPTIVLRRHRQNTDVLVVRATNLDGKAVPGAKVLATTIPWDIHLLMGPAQAGMVAHSKRGVTDDKGVLRLGPLEPGLYNIVVTASGFETTPRPNVLVTSGGERRVTMRLPNAVTVRGRVIDQEGEPVANAMVMGMAMPMFASSLAVTTNKDGEFVLDDLKAGGYMFMAHDEGRGSTFSQGSAPSNGVELVLKGAGVIKGTVVDAKGEPASDAKIRAFQAGPFRYTYSQVYDVKADGSFEIPLPKGTWNVVAKLSTGAMSETASADLENGTTAEVKLKIQKTLAVRGVVVDAKGDHVSGAHVFVKMGEMPRPPSRELAAHTDSDGAFSIVGFEPGSVTLHVTHPLHADTTFEATPAEDAAEVKVTLGEGGRVFGRMVDAEGAPVPNHQINLVIPQSFMESRTTYTNSAGAYEFRTLPAATYSMNTGSSFGGLQRAGVVVTEGGSTEINWTKPAAGGTVTGTVMLGGEPVGGARVTAVDTRGPDDARTGTTDEQGAFTITGVEMGTVRVRAETATGLTGRANADVKPDAPGTVTIHIENAGLRARLLSVDGVPLSGIWSNIEAGDASGWTGYRQLPVTGGDGIIQSQSLPEGTYRLRASEADHATFVSPPFTLKSGTTVDLGDFVLKRAAQITGKLTNDAGSPVEGATVSLYTEDGRPVFNFSMSTTGSDGRFIVRGVESGRYRVRFEAKGHAPGDTWVDVADGRGSADGVVSRGGTLRFLVVNDTDEPLAGARITIYDSQNHVVVKTLSMTNWQDTGRRFTGADGRTSLDDLAAGAYRVVAQLDGYADLGNGKAARVAPGESTDVRIVLSKTE